MENGQDNSAQAFSTPGAAQGKVPMRDAFIKHQAAIRAVPRDRLRHINLDVAVMLLIAYKAWVNIVRFMERLKRLGAEIDYALIEQLPSLFEALQYCDTQCVQLAAGPTPVEVLEALSAEGDKWRTLLTDGVRMLEKVGVVNAAHLLPRLSNNARGYANTARDLGLLANFYIANWAVIEGKLPVTLADVERAGTLATRLNEATVSRGASPQELEEAELLRQQAFALVLDIYEDARWGVLLIRRRERDGDDMVPSLYTGRTNHPPKRTDKPEAEEPALAPTESAPVEAAPASQGPIGNMPGSPFVK